MFLQSYLYWQTAALHGLPSIRKMVEHEEGNDEILRKGIEFVQKDTQTYLDLVTQSAHVPEEGPASADFRDKLVRLVGACQYINGHSSLGEMFALCESDPLNEAYEAMARANWGKGWDATLIVNRNMDYVSGVKNKRLTTVTRPSYAIAAYTESELSALLSAVFNVVKNSSQRPCKSMEDTGYSKFDVKHLTVFLRDLSPMDVAVLHNPTMYTAQQIWDYWAHFYDVEHRESHPKPRSGLAKMSLG